MRYKPLGERILVIQHKGEEKTKGGLIIAETAVANQFKGTVVAVGSKVEEILVDDVVMFGKQFMQGILIDEKPYIVLREQDIYCYDEEAREKKLHIA